MKPQMYIRPSTGAAFATDFRPKARILKTGGVVLNQSAMTSIGLGPDPDLDHQELIFYWYPDTKSLGFRRAATGDRDDARFKGRVNKETMSFRAKEVFLAFGVEIEHAAGDYTIGQDDREGLWLIKPSQEITATRTVDTSGISARLASARNGATN